MAECWSRSLLETAGDVLASMVHDFLSRAATAVFIDAGVLNTCGGRRATGDGQWAAGEATPVAHEKLVLASIISRIDGDDEVL